MPSYSVKLFGPEALAAGAKEVTVECEGSPTPDELRVALADACPALAPSMSICRVARNHAFAGPDERLSSDDEIALIGMVSGG